MLGAYFGSVKINEGAAGLGNLHAYADGVVGGSAQDAERPGRLMAYQDGSLGLGRALGESDAGQLRAYADGIVGGSAVDAEMPGPLRAYHDGALGQDSLVYDDGILGGGGESGSEVHAQSLQAYRDGSLGRLRLRRAMGAAENNVLNLGDPLALKEVKSAMALLAPEVAVTQEAQKLFTPDFYVSEIWEPHASLLWQAVLAKAPAGSDFSSHSGAQVFPNAQGVAWMAATIGAPVQGSYGPQYLAQNLPILNAWLQAGGGQVLPPYLSLGDKVRGKPASTTTASMGTMAAYGVGAVVLFGLALYAKKRRR